MARGFLSGAVVGMTVSALALGVVSVLGGISGEGAPETGALEVPPGSEFNRARDDEEAALPEVAAQPEAPSAPQVAAPEPDDPADLATGITDPGTPPQAGQAQDALPEPQSGAASSDISVEGDSPVLPSPQAVAPTIPADESDLSISADPAQPALPDVEGDTPFQDDTSRGANGTARDAGGEAASAGEPSGSDPVEQNDARDGVTVEDAPAPDADDTADAPEARPQAEEAAPALDAEAVPETAASDAEEERADDSTIGNLATGVITDRLPSVGGTAAPQEAAGQAKEAAAPAAAALPALERYAADFENPEGKPLMSVILIDDGSSPLGMEALTGFPYPLSFAVDAGWDGATEAMAEYRAAGFEVLAMTDLPEGAGAQDTEVALQSVFARLPEVVAVMDGTGSGLRASRAAIEQLAPILEDTGHGAVFFPEGLNTAEQRLTRAGVPALTAFRDFDANDQSATVIRRFLDQAAFKAAQEDAGVIMVGRLRPDTISALVLWGLQDRAQRVALAPVSALLGGG